MKRFVGETLLEIRDWLVGELRGAATADFEVVDPTLGPGKYSGEPVVVEGQAALHRGYRCWVDLAELMGCRLVIPREAPEATDLGEGFVRLRFEKLERGDSFHAADVGDPTEKYGAQSPFARLHKLEEPSFALALEAAFQRVDLPPRARVLDLGVNTGDELELLRRVYGAPRFDELELVGVDHSASAIAQAEGRFDGDHCRLLVHDINALAELDLGRFDLLLSVGTLHSPSIRNSKQLFQSLMQDHLKPTGAVILGFPNCRWHDGEVLYGAHPPNYNHPELSVVLKDVDWCKRYLQQHRYRVTITGRHYLFVTATRIGVEPIPHRG